MAEPIDPNHGTTPQRQQKYDNDLLKEFVALQKQEIVVRQNELSIKGQEIDNQKEVALRSISAQESDLKDSRHHQRRSSIITKIFILALIVTVSGLIIYLIEKGKDQIAVELLKLVSVALISFGGGYFYGKAKGRDDQGLDSSGD